MKKKIGEETPGMRKNYFLLSLAVLLSCVGCNKEYPAESIGAYVSFKADIRQNGDTKVAVEAIEGKEDAFNITGWKDGDRIVCGYNKDGVSGNSVTFTYNKEDNQFAAMLPAGLSMEDLSACFYLGDNFTRLENDAFTVGYNLEVPVDITGNEAKCPLVGGLTKKEEEGLEYVATMKAGYALACIHNQSSAKKEFVVSVKNNGGVKYLSGLTARYDAGTKSDSFEYATTTDITSAKTVSIGSGAKKYIILPVPQDGDSFAVCYKSNGNPIQVSTYKNSITAGSVYKIFVEMALPRNDERGANCHLINELNSSKTIGAHLVGNSTGKDIRWESAEVLWESFGNANTPATGGVITISADKSNQTIAVTGKANGNAVVAVKNAMGTILWSWHIWVCNGYDPVSSAHIYNNDAGIVMDRNLGATTAEPGELGALGLLYQWGRKDPFLSGRSTVPYDDVVPAASTGTWESPINSIYTGTGDACIEYSVNHPMQIITKNSQNDDWYYTGTTRTDNTRWTTKEKAKGIYDPCPYGWRIPDGGKGGLWSKALGFDGT